MIVVAAVGVELGHLTTLWLVTRLLIGAANADGVCAGVGLWLKLRHATPVATYEVAAKCHPGFNTCDLTARARYSHKNAANLLLSG